MRYLTFEEVAYLHELIIDRTGGLGGFLNPEALESAVAQPQQSFGGHELYPTLHEKTRDNLTEGVVTHMVERKR